MKKCNRLIVILVLISLTGCAPYSTNATKSNQSNNALQDNNEVKVNPLDTSDTDEADGSPDRNNVKSFFWCEGFSIPAPKPDSNYIVAKDFGTLCYEFNKDRFIKYQKELELQDWVCISTTEIWGKKNYTYTKGDMNLQIIDNTMDTDYKIDSSILVNFTYGNDKMAIRAKAVTKLEAIDLIEERCKELKELGVDLPFHYESIGSMMIERYIEDSYEKMGLQAFSVVSDKGNLIGNFLICNQFVLPVLDTLEQTSIVDIDNDGEYELLSLYGWGSGIYRIELNAYKNINPISFSSKTKILQLGYHSSFVPKDGYGKLLFKKISNNEVRLLDQDWKTEDKGLVETNSTDYGKIILGRDGYHLIPEYQENFPYDQWDYSYDQRNLKLKTHLVSDNQTNLTLEEPPEIKITIGDKNLVYDTIKIKWNSVESTEDIDFTSLMSNIDTIPVFDNPGNMLEYKDSIILDFGDITPDSIEVKDYLLKDDGRFFYGEKASQDRAVRIEEDGTFSFGLYQHMALMLSSSMLAYEQTSYRGFRILCNFGDKKCEYIFVLGLSPSIKQ